MPGRDRVSSVLIKFDILTATQHRAMSSQQLAVGGCRVVRMYAYSVVRLDEGVVDGDDLDLVVLDTVGDVNYLTKQRRSC
jgi:hypothetical protein